MKRLLPLLLIIPLISSCKKIDDLKTFTVDFDTQFTIPAAMPVGIVDSIATPSVQHNMDQEFSNNGADINHVEKIRLTSLTLTITEPAGEDFSFLNSIRIYMEAPGLQPVEIAYLENIPATATTLNLETSGAVLDDYLRQDTFTLTQEFETDEVTTEDITIRSDMVFEVKAKIL